MMPLARLWTWTGQLFIPLALGWAVYVRNGLDTTAEGVVVSRAYAGLLLTLACGAVLCWAFALYVRAAKQRGAHTLVPPNTTFEDKKERNRTLSWATAVVFAVAILAGSILFASSYSNSRIHGWDATTPLSNDFWSSRLAAHGQGCPAHPCFALGPRMVAGRGPINGVFEYLPFLTDGAVLLLAFAFLSGIVLVLAAWREPVHLRGR